MKIRRVMEVPKAPVILYPVPYFWFFIILAIAIGLYVAIESFSDFTSIQADWPKYRCQPQFMPFAGLFGQDITTNFEFCLSQIIQKSTSGVAGPFAQGMFGFSGILSNLMNSANSFRTMMATLVGGVIKIVGEFKARMTSLMGRVKLTAARMKAMMYRVYGTMFAVIYMGLSAQTGIANFGDTFIFKFIDTFCFPPEQPILLENGESVAISEILVGDILVGGHRVETVYIFSADGQEMVSLNGIEVSSNHFVMANGKWKMAKDHPDAIPLFPWAGGVERPLVCLSTHDHLIDIGHYIFADYDETEKGNHSTQLYVHKSLNGLCSLDPSIHKETSYEIGTPGSTEVKTAHGYKKISEIRLGERITESFRVVGILLTELSEFCVLPSGIHVGSGTLLWNKGTEQWLRACTVYPVYKTTPKECYALFVSPGASYEFKDGTSVRDAMEVYSPDTKKAYADILLGDASF
jgi:hypothetical protein